MKKYIHIIAYLIVASGLIGFAFAQTKQLPSLDTEIPFDKEPTVIKQMQPVYPEKMLRDGVEATVYVKVFIDVDGAVVDTRTEKVQVIMAKSAGQKDETEEKKIDGKGFEKAALDAVKQWKFSPAQMQGKPVAVWITIPFRFKLREKETKPEDEAIRKEMEKSIESIKTVIENILKGTELEQAKKHIGRQASLIYNAKIANLYSVLNGEQKDIQLSEGQDAACLNMNVKITEGGKSALIVLTSELPKGKTKHVHSIVLARESVDSWKIINWHVSS